MEILGLGLAHEGAIWFGVLVDSQDRLVISSFSSRNDPTRRLAHVAKKIAGSTPRKISHPYAEMMVELFKGRLITQPIRLNPKLVSPFQERVYKVLRKVPRTRVTTYGAIAEAIASGSRAVGTAVGSNPWSLFVPCHRVVPSSFTVGQYSMDGRPGREGSRIKRQILSREGVMFHEDKILPESVWIPTVA